jgi:hypothetical protein
MAKPRLILRDLRHPGLSEGSYELNRSPIRIGRGPRCEIRLHSDRIADVQVILRHESDRWTLHPVGPPEGCEIHGGFLSESARLDPGTLFRIGHVELTMGPIPARVETAPAHPPSPQFEPATPPPCTEIDRPAATALSASAMPVDILPQIAEPKPTVVADLGRSENTAPSPMAIPVQSVGPILFGEAPEIRRQSSVVPSVAARHVHGSAPEASDLLNAPAAPVARFVRPKQQSTLIGSMDTPICPSGHGDPIRKPSAASSLAAFGAIVVGEPVRTRAASPNGARARTRYVPPSGTNQPSDLNVVFDPIDRRRPAANPERKPASIAPIAEVQPPFVESASGRRPPLKRMVRDHEPASLFDDWTVRAATVAPELMPRKAAIREESPTEAFAEAIAPSKPIDESIATNLPTDDEPGVAEVVPEANVLFECENAESATISESVFEQADFQVSMESESAEADFETHQPLSFDTFPTDIDSSEEPLKSAATVDDLIACGPCESAAEVVIEAPTEACADVVVEPAAALGIAEFESWLRSVGPNLEPIPAITVQNESNDSPDRIEPPAEFESTESTEPSEEIPPYSDGPGAASLAEEAESFASAEGRSRTIAKPAAFDERRQAASTPRDGFADQSIDPKIQEIGRKLDVNEWPSAQDILRWSADRHGRSFLMASSADLSRMSRTVPRTQPQEFMRLNFPTALLMCLVFLGGSGVLVAVGARMSRQDELTQRSIGALTAAAETGAIPRLDRPSHDRLGQIPSWWEAPDEQIWWRSAFLRVREEKGQPGQVASSDLAAVVAGRSPLLPSARLWNRTRKAAEGEAASFDGLSRDVLPLLLAADHHRRTGDMAAANRADRIALELVTSGEPAADQEEIVFDAEFGMNRFLLPGQKAILTILKRLASEPDAAAILVDVMPENRPLVWLTAAQLLRHSGIGDSEKLVDRVAAWPIPTSLPDHRRHLAEAVRAESLVLKGETRVAIETYERLAKTLPASEWKRSVYFNMGELHLRSQKREAALLALRKARGDDPNHQVDRHAIAAIRGLSGASLDSPRTETTLRAN